MNRNLVLITGRLGADPEIHTFNNGNKKATLRVATSHKYKNKDGEFVDDTQWHNVVVYGSSVTFVEKYCTKGDVVDVDGRIATRSYDSNGETKYVTEIIANGIQKYWPPRDQPATKQPEISGTPESGDDDLPFA